MIIIHDSLVPYDHCNCSKSGTLGTLINIGTLGTLETLVFWVHLGDTTETLGIQKYHRGIVSAENLGLEELSLILGLLGLLELLRLLMTLEQLRILVISLW
jgi:hypothetical protein